MHAEKSPAIAKFNMSYDGSIIASRQKASCFYILPLSAYADADWEAGRM